MSRMPDQLDSNEILEATIAAEGSTLNRFDTMVGRLSKLSVEKHFDAYADIDWDDPALAIDPDDPRWELWGLDQLSVTEWYRAQPPGVRSRIGLHRMAQALHTAWQFENILQVGLLIYAMRLSNDSTEFRYLHHEIVEESQHSMMFYEFVKRSKMPARGMPRLALTLIRPGLMLAAKWDPILLFFAALAGEEPGDYLQRVQLKSGIPHPLIEQITRIHVTEEARHISFARHYMRRRLPTMSKLRRGVLSVVFPIFMVVGARLMLLPGRTYLKGCRIPRRVLKNAYKTPAGRAMLANSVHRARGIAYELGLMNPTARFVWRAIGGGEGRSEQVAA
jgi:para-aminobenzoate N-oxygenase AurF